MMIGMQKLKHVRTQNTIMLLNNTRKIGQVRAMSQLSSLLRGTSSTTLCARVLQLGSNVAALSTASVRSSILARHRTLFPSSASASCATNSGAASVGPQLLPARPFSSKSSAAKAPKPAATAAPAAPKLGDLRVQHAKDVQKLSEVVQANKLVEKAKLMAAAPGTFTLFKKKQINNKNKKRMPRVPHGQRSYG